MSSPRIDPLDNPDYDPVRHLNFIFARPSALQRLDEVREHVDLYGAVLDRQIVATYPSSYSEDEWAKIARASNGPEELALLAADFAQLKKLCHTTGRTIQDSTKDIKRLDNTKSNLTQTMTVLKRLQMLTIAYGQLNCLIKNRKYKEMSQTLPAVMELMSHFQSYRSIDQVALLSKQVAEVQTAISGQIFADFAIVLEGRTDDPKYAEIAGSLADACRVVDSLPGNQRQQLTTWYCNLQLREYRQIFKTSDEAGSLENISRRFGYVKRLLKRHAEELDQYFDPDWEMTRELTFAFCKATKEDISVLLSSQREREVNVQLLLNALEQTLQFEQELEKRFPVSGSKHRTTTPIFSKIISSAFQPHLNLWIQRQDRILSDKFAQYRAPPTPQEDKESHPTVLPSSADLFMFYKQILAQTAKLSTGSLLVDLAFLFSRWLSTYCHQILRVLIPDRLNTHDDVLTACLVLNTADYCLTTTTQMEQRLLDVIDPELKDKIDLENARNKFLEIINLAIGSLVANVQQACELPFREMVNTNWAKLTSVGDSSSYVSSLKVTIEQETGAILDQLTRDTYRRILCDKIVDAITLDFLGNAARCKPISEVSAEQMLLDLYVVKNSFLVLPSLKGGVVPSESEEANKPSESYARHVSRSLGRVETVLKMILTAADPAQGFVQNYFYLIGDKSIGNFVKILDLKGINRNQQSRFIEIFHATVKNQEILIDESPTLKNLRLNPLHVKTSSTTNFVSPTSFEAPKVFSKEGFEKGFERFAHSSEVPVSKINENFRSIGRLFRRDGSGSPLGRRDASN